ncbi:helix-turn-helix transcriptional regulator [Halalkalicoccus jeotgali]|uniref:DNA binding protein n=1 Tax=Halalkalicoccus jeotgali (strain DSM 18796 / CECT 7217 / JCM 14584 / KCTC 4019 / B3) TaxID=795797 RepID=D8J5X3_HALJB|nr:ArsR family transcriptional regulator [Halalkalicoccus jeotgali]ADJ13779.1 putative DNA binding protein [Halalkalicoccus jeotgali B3]ELY34175.1 putative DNA binding protein [Halalkalicoccus jeotgali B3]
MESALAEIEFLALSSNRVAVLEALTEGVHTRSELADVTGASQPTLGRILRDLEERRWIARTDGGYEATATGRMVAEGMTDLLAIVETEAKLRPVVEWLPAESMDFDLGRLRDATITVPSRTRPSAPVKRVNETLRRAEDVQVCSHALNEGTLETVRERVVNGQQRFKGVLSRTAIDALAEDDSLRARLRELVAAEDATIRSHPEEIPIAVTVADGRVYLLVRDDDGVLQAAVDTDDPDVVSWAESVHERYWSAASPVEPDTL